MSCLWLCRFVVIFSGNLFSLCCSLSSLFPSFNLLIYSYFFWSIKLWKNIFQLFFQLYRQFYLPFLRFSYIRVLGVIKPFSSHILFLPFLSFPLSLNLSFFEITCSLVMHAKLLFSSQRLLSHTNTHTRYSFSFGHIFNPLALFDAHFTVDLMLASQWIITCVRLVSLSLSIRLLFFQSLSSLAVASHNQFRFWRVFCRIHWVFQCS